VRARVEIHLKKGVTDPEGDNVLKALKLLGFGSVTRVRSIKVFEIDIGEKTAAKARAAVEEMCRKLLANPVIHDYRIKVVGGRASIPRR
jgi:phosphoribosylformylglycinamidine synthase